MIRGADPEGGLLAMKQKGNREGEDPSPSLSGRIMLLEFESESKPESSWAFYATYISERVFIS